jgi:hypothetical protein
MVLLLRRYFVAPRIDDFPSDLGTFLVIHERDLHYHPVRADTLNIQWSPLRIVRIMVSPVQMTIGVEYINQFSIAELVKIGLRSVRLFLGYRICGYCKRIGRRSRYILHDGESIRAGGLP